MSSEENQNDPLSPQRGLEGFGRDTGVNSLFRNTLSLCPVANWRHIILKKKKKSKMLHLQGWQQISEQVHKQRSNLKQREDRITSALHQLYPIPTLTPPSPPLLYLLPPHSHMLTRVAPNGLNEGHLGDGIRLRQQSDRVRTYSKSM